MSVWKEVTAAIGWISGSLAGIGACFYACGYLSEGAYLHLLGATGLISLNHEQYVQEGGKFLVETSNIMAQVALDLLLVAVMIVVLGFLLRRTRFRHSLDDVKSWFSRLSESKRSFLRGLSYGILLLILLQVTGIELAHFTAPLNVSDLLFTPANAVLNDVKASADAKEIRNSIFAGETAYLNDYFFGLTLSVIKAGVIFLIAWKIVEPWRLRLLLGAPFALAFFLSVLLLPMSYGVLKRPARFPTIVFDSHNKALSSGQGELYLLDRSNDSFVVWDADHRHVLWLPRTQVESAQIGQRRFLFSTQRRVR